jgi:hypothetical protein
LKGVHKLNDFQGQWIGFYVRGVNRSKNLEKQISELFLFATLNKVDPKKIIFAEDNCRVNQNRPSFYKVITFPLLSYLVIVRHQIISNDYATYLKLKQKIEETMHIEIINLEEVKKQAGAI